MGRMWGRASRLPSKSSLARLVLRGIQTVATGLQCAEPVCRPGANQSEAYFGCATVRRYGFSVLKPCGYLFFASSSDTDVAMMTSSPGFQFTGVATVCLAVNWQESSRR